jgi:hypothetical protein
MKSRILVIGSGQRVRRAALPAILSRRETWQLAGIRSRKPKQIHAETAAGEPVGDPLNVEALAALTTTELANVDVVYMCVSKGAVPGVLGQLAELVAPIPAADRPRLFIDTPVLLFKHMHAAKRFAAFPEVSVAEDMSSLPWLASLDYARQALGKPRHLLLDRSAFAYHGVAFAKTLLGNMRVERAARKPFDGAAQAGDGRPATFERTLTFAGGQTCTILEERDYSVGRVRLECERGVLTLGPEPEAGAWWLSQTLDAAGNCVGFTANKDGERAFASALTDADRALLGPLSAPGPIQSMDAMKRVGFARLLDRMHQGDPVWTLLDGLDDMWIDYLVEKTGRWRATRFTSVHAPLARKTMGVLMGLASKVKQ